ncbi:MAG: hypothetical protein WCL23_00520 [Candidatus Moraniibacteriota bacterium]
MEKEPNISGKDLLPELRKEAVKEIARIKAEGKEKMAGEYKKTVMELRFINLVNKYIAEEFEELGVDGFSQIEPEQVHLLDHDGYYNSLNARKTGRGTSRIMKGAAYICRDNPEHRLDTYVAMLHESVHLCSCEKTEIYTLESDELHDFIDTSRTGYANFIYVEDRYEGNHEHFRGLNEAVTDMFVIDFFTRHKGEIADCLQITENEASGFQLNYSVYVELLEGIIEKISEFRNETSDETRKRFKRGALTGDMTHLRDIEHIYGPGSLRVLAAADSWVDGNEPNGEKIDKLFAFFKAEDDGEREKTALEILNEREREAYLKIRRKSISDGETISE